MAPDPRRAALARLPLPYATALRLRSAGVDDARIARRIRVDLDVLPTLMRLAEAKLAAAERAERAEGAERAERAEYAERTEHVERVEHTDGAS